MFDLPIEKQPQRYMESILKISLLTTKQNEIVQYNFSLLKYKKYSLARWTQEKDG